LENQGDFQPFPAEPAAGRRRAGVFDRLGGRRQVELGADQAFIAAPRIAAEQRGGEKGRNQEIGQPYLLRHWKVTSF
jgi:hypothetical protein